MTLLDLLSVSNKYRPGERPEEIRAGMGLATGWTALGICSSKSWTLEMRRKGSWTSSRDAVIEYLSI